MADFIWINVVENQSSNDLSLYFAYQQGNGNVPTVSVELGTVVYLSPEPGSNGKEQTFTQGQSFWAKNVWPHASLPDQDYYDSNYVVLKPGTVIQLSSGVIPYSTSNQKLIIGAKDSHGVFTCVGYDQGIGQVGATKGNSPCLRASSMNHEFLEDIYIKNGGWTTFKLKYFTHPNLHGHQLEWELLSQVNIEESIVKVLDTTLQYASDILDLAAKAKGLQG